MKIEFCPYCGRRHFHPRLSEQLHIEFEYYLEFFWCDCGQFFFRWYFQKYNIYSMITTIEFVLNDESQFKQAVRHVFRLEHAYLNAIWKHSQKNRPIIADGATLEECRILLEEIKEKFEEGERILK